MSFFPSPHSAYNRCAILGIPSAQSNKRDNLSGRIRISERIVQHVRIGVNAPFKPNGITLERTHLLLSVDSHGEQNTGHTPHKGYQDQYPLRVIF